MKQSHATNVFLKVLGLWTLERGALFYAKEHEAITRNGEERAQ